MCDLYRSELEDAVCGLQTRGLLEATATSRRSSRSARSRTESTRERLWSETEDEDYIQRRAVIEVFTWTTILLTFSAASSWLGSFIAGCFSKLVIGEEVAALVAYVIMPGLAASTLLKQARNFTDDASVRFTMLWLAVVQGLVIGCIRETKNTMNEPFVFVTSAAFAVGYAVTLKMEVKGSRALLVAAILTALLANYLIGSLLGDVSHMFELMTFAYVAASAATMQLVSRCQRETGSVHMLQFILLESTIYIRALCHTIGGH